MDDNSIKETEDGRSTKSVGFKNNPLFFRKNITVAIFFRDQFFFEKYLDYS